MIVVTRGGRGGVAALGVSGFGFVGTAVRVASLSWAEPTREAAGVVVVDVGVGFVVNVAGDVGVAVPGAVAHVRGVARVGVGARTSAPAAGVAASVRGPRLAQRARRRDANAGAGGTRVTLQAAGLVNMGSGHGRKAVSRRAKAAMRSPDADTAGGSRGEEAAGGGAACRMAGAEAPSPVLAVWSLRGSIRGTCPLPERYA